MEMLPCRELPDSPARGRMGLSGMQDLYTLGVRYVEAGARFAAGDQEPPVII
jgi:hypothetical protein